MFGVASGAFPTLSPVSFPALRPAPFPALSPVSFPTLRPCPALSPCRPGAKAPRGGRSSSHRVPGRRPFRPGGAGCPRGDGPGRFHKSARWTGSCPQGGPCALWITRLGCGSNLPGIGFSPYGDVIHVTLPSTQRHVPFLRRRAPSRSGGRPAPPCRPAAHRSPGREARDPRAGSASGRSGWLAGVAGAGGRNRSSGPVVGAVSCPFPEPAGDAPDGSRGRPAGRTPPVAESVCFRPGPTCRAGY